MECVIDESLDQRRKASTSRQTESQTGQREVLSSLLQSIQYSDWTDVEELIGAIRNNLPPEAITTILQRNASSLQLRGDFLPVPIGELQVAFLASQDTSTNLRPATSAGQSEDSHNIVEAEMIDREFEATQKSYGGSQILQSRIQTHYDQLKAYSRWIDLFGTFPSLESDRKLERTPTSNQENLRKPSEWDEGLWRKTTRLRVSGPESSTMIQRTWEADLIEKRRGWHPALQIQVSPDDNAVELPPGLNLEEVTTLIAAQESGESGGWVEIYRGIAGANQEAGKADPGIEAPYHFEYTRHPLYHVQTATALENSPLSRVVTDYRDAARKAIAQGMSAIDILGHDGIAIELFLRDRTSDDEFTVSNWASEVTNVSVLIVK